MPPHTPDRPLLLNRWSTLRRGTPCPERVICTTTEYASTIAVLALAILTQATTTITWAVTAAAAIPAALAYGWNRGYEHHADKHCAPTLATQPTSSTCHGQPSQAK